MDYFSDFSEVPVLGKCEEQKRGHRKATTGIAFQYYWFQPEQPVKIMRAAEYTLGCDVIAAVESSWPAIPTKQLWFGNISHFQQRLYCMVQCNVYSGK